MTTEIVKTWNTKSGKLVIVTGRLSTERTVNLDGHIDTIPECEIYINVNVQGHGDQGGWVREIKPVTVDGIIYTHKVGDMALTPDKAELINSVRLALESLPEWQDKQAQIDANEKAEAEIWAERKANGYCFKCHSYCDGDCEAN